MPMPSRATVPTLALAAALGGCAGTLERAADRQVADILAGKSAGVEALRAERFVSPRTAGQEAARGEAAADAGTGSADGEIPADLPEVLRVEDAIRLAFRENRDYESRRESLYLSALGLTGTRYEFSPRFSSALSYVVGHAADRTLTRTGAADVTVSQVLPLGGSVSVSGDTGLADRRGGDPGGGPEYSHGVSATLTQPLLRGFGWEASHEALTQAERQVVYDVREFARYREQFLVDVVGNFYELVAQREVVENTRKQYERQEWETRRTRALFEVGRQSQLEVLRAETDLLGVQTNLENAEARLALATDQFKLFLGLPTRVSLVLADDPPPMREVDVSLASAVEAALANRFDFANAREQMEDAERSFRIAKQALLPRLDLQAQWSSDAARRARPFDSHLEAGASSLGLTLEVPLQRTQERNAFRSAQIALDRQRRSLRETRDALVVEVREAHRAVRQAAVNIRIQENTIAAEEFRERKARLEFESGKIGNRDLLEAQRSLLNARNAKVQELVRHEIARINLERAMGTLDVGDDGAWDARRAGADGAEGGTR